MTKMVAHAKDLLDMPGDLLGPTEWMEMTQARINQFADATEDHQWIHVDASKAAEGPFGACIAHGFLTLSLAAKFQLELIQVECKMGVNYGCEKVRFPNSVKVGQRIRGRGEVQSAIEKSGGYQVIIQITIEIEGEERPACVVNMISLFIPD